MHAFLCFSITVDMHIPCLGTFRPNSHHFTWLLGFARPLENATCRETNYAAAEHLYGILLK